MVQGAPLTATGGMPKADAGLGDAGGVGPLAGGVGGAGKAKSQVSRDFNF